MPVQAGGRLFYTLDTGKADFPVLYVKFAGADRARLLLDPNALSQDRTVALTRYVPSPDGRLLAYGLARSGSDWREWKILDVESGEVLSDALTGIKWSAPSWSRDGKGLFYSRYPEAARAGTAAAEGEKVFFHRLGGRAQDDVLVFDPGQPRWLTLPQATDDGRYLVLQVYKSSDGRSVVFVIALPPGASDDPASLRRAAPVRIGDDFASAFAFIDNVGTRFWFKTTFQAARGRIVAVDLAEPALAKLQEVVAQGDRPVEDVSLVGDRLFVSSIQDARTRVDVYDLAGRHERSLPLPGAGTAHGFAGRRADQETFFAFQNTVTPVTIYRYDVARGRAEPFHVPRARFMPDEFVTQDLFVRSPDGTMVPLSVSHRRRVVLDGRNPTILYGYGCYGDALTPSFAVSRIAWMEKGGVFAVAHVRGGGEYGDQWHQDGMGTRKQNSVDDLGAAARWLIGNQVTSPRHLGVHGASCGGLLAGASLVQTPELFGAAVVEVGILDLLRFSRFTGAYLWEDELGSPARPDQFPALRALSPLHNVKEGVAYPATLVMTARNDTRVVPAHSTKFAAALQSAQAGGAPILLRVEKEGGHGEGLAKGRLLDLNTDRLIFLWDALRRR